MAAEKPATMLGGGGRLGTKMVILGADNYQLGLKVKPHITQNKMIGINAIPQLLSVGPGAGEGEAVDQVAAGGVDGVAADDLSEHLGHRGDGAGGLPEHFKLPVGPISNFGCS